MVGLELNARVSEKQHRLSLQSTLRESLAALSNTTKRHHDLPTPADKLGDGNQPCCVSLDASPPHVQGTDSPFTRGDTGRQGKSTTGFLLTLDFSDDEPANLLHMVTPTKEELETPMRSEATLLTPGNGRPATDPAVSYTHLTLPTTILV